MKTKMSTVVAIVFLTLVAGVASAQWSTDPAAPFVVADRSFAQVQAKIVARSDGGFYVSWFDNSTDGYDVYLQRLDLEGNELWAHNGVLVADRGFSSTQDYGLGIDTSGNALLAFRDDRGATTEITVALVEPNGTLKWGSAGVQVSSGGVFVAAPKVTGTSDGEIVVAWTNDVDVKLQRLDAMGAAQWGAGITYTAAAGSLAASDLHASETGNAIVSWVHTTGSFSSPKHLMTQKLAAADGASLWGTGHVPIYDVAGGSLQFGYFPSFIVDGSGGAVFAWYTSVPALQVRAQRIFANGSEAFAHQGIEVSTNATRIRTGGVAALNPTTDEIIVAFTEQDPSQTQSGLYAQKLDVTGTRQWTDDGIPLMPVSSDTIYSTTILSMEDGALVTWIHSPSFGNDPVYSIRVDGTSDFSWNPPIAELCILPTESSGLVAAMSQAGFAAYAWSDGGSSAGDIFAAAIDPEGSLGNTGLIFGDGFESGNTIEWSATTP